MPSPFDLAILSLAQETIKDTTKRLELLRPENFSEADAGLIEDVCGDLKFALKRLGALEH